MADDVFEIGLMLNAAPAAAGAAAAVQSFRAILDILQSARDEAARLGNETYKFRDSLRDIQALRGGGPVTDETMKAQLDLSRRTGMSLAETHEFSESFLGEAAVHLEKYSQADQQRFQEVAGTYGRMMGIPGKTMGQFIGRIIGQHPEGITPVEAAGEAAESYRVLGMGSGSTPEALQSVMNYAASAVLPGGMGAVENMRNIGVLGMGASRAGRESTIDTTLRQFQRAVLGQGGSPEWNRYIREEAGVQEGEHVEQAMIKVFEQMSEVARVPTLTGSEPQIAAQVQAHAAGQTREGRDVTAWLIERGVRSQEERQALVAMWAQSGTMIPELQHRGPDPEMTGARVLEQNARYLADPRSGRAAVSIATGKADEIERGRQQEVMMTYLREEANELYRAGRIGAPAMAENALENIMTRPTGLMSREDILVYQGARQRYERENRVQLPGGEPSQTSDFLARTLTGWPMLAESALGAVGINLGTDWQGQNMVLRNAISNRIDPRSVNLAESIQQVEDAQRSDPTAFRTMMGPNAQMMTTEQYRQYGRNVEHWTPAQEAQNMPIWVKRLSEEIAKVNNQSPRPMGVGAAKPEKVPR